MTENRINREQRLYIFPAGKGYTCLGWDVAERLRLSVVAWCGLPRTKLRLGTMKHLAEYEKTMSYGAGHAMATGERCLAELTPELIGLEGARVEVVDRYDERRRFWVGRSTGWMPCHLEIATRRSHGGGAVTGAPFKSLQVLRKHR